MKTIKFILFIFLVSYAANAQDKTALETKDTIGKTKNSPITKETQIQTAVIICGPSRSTLIELLYVLNGKIIDQVQFSKINPNAIESLKVLRPEEAKLIYGEQGKNGAIIIISKK
ncbi:TonB-dependent Receptor Plug Domain [Flavobacterium resistens]|uniref:TonB-dependent Receptor Plug Domain n=1 Tax=Flavobacterium resistens TaxID=443612 RepID=A0A521DVH1_9FLAO|nr:TonB-dependent receptor plug domain-containing protein [Flavobacterium resistens]MRX68120.1 TonB-dependent receptor plug domain-containing protein [Flavobacterium resistens]SMO75645.1 TonB-dependent Receptor Plug Domain [Flavobacterium resistens]